jgi:uncharacterized protein DUF4230
MARQLLESDTSENRVRPHRRWWKLAVAAAVVAVAVPVGFEVAGALPGPDTVEQQTVDHSSGALLVALDDIAEYHAATGTFQVLVDLEKDTPWVPSVISGERTTLFATGHADALVDFTGLGPERVAVSPDRRTATITLPPPRLAPATIDPAQSRVVGRDRGIAERLAGLVEDNPVDDQEVYRLATQKLDDAARQSDLPTRAETSTRDMLTSLTRSLGYEQVTVTFADPR